MNVSERAVREKIQAAELVEQQPELEEGSGGSAKKVISIHKTQEAEKKFDELPEKNIQSPKDIKCKYETIVIDPPWPMKRIFMEERNTEPGFDYPTMDLIEIGDFPIELFMSEDCGLFMWTTQRFLPAAIDMIKKWGFNYVFTMVWHKAGGFQPIGLPQYNCEFVVYGRKGKVEFNETKSFFLCNKWDRGKHSEKPQEFYDLIKRVTAPPRIDIFARKERDGFHVWGNEV